MFKLLTLKHRCPDLSWGTANSDSFTVVVEGQCWEMLLQTTTFQHLYRFNPNLGLCRSMHMSCVQLLSIHTKDTLSVLCSPCLIDEHLSGSLNFINLSDSSYSICTTVDLVHDSLEDGCTSSQPFCCSQPHCTEKRGWRNQRLTPNQESSSPPRCVVTFLLWTTICYGVSTVDS